MQPNGGFSTFLLAGSFHVYQIEDRRHLERAVVRRGIFQPSPRRGGLSMRIQRCLFSLATAVAITLPSGPASAQVAGNGYLFHAPYVTLGVRGGYANAIAGSDVFDDVTRQLTLNKSDFGSLTIGADVAFRLTSHLDLTLDAAYSRSNRKSDFRDFVDNNDLPIEQTTSFERIPLTD